MQDQRNDYGYSNVQHIGYASRWLLSDRSSLLHILSTRIVICRQDGRGRFPASGASSPNVGQTHNEIFNIVRFIICFI